MVHTTNHVTSVPDQHTISWDTFDELAAGAGGTSTGSVLRSADRSRRLLLLSGLVDLARADERVTGPLASAETAWRLIEAAASDSNPDRRKQLMIAASLAIEQEDFDLVPFSDFGGLGAAYQLFGDKLPTLLNELNERLSA